MKNDSQASVTTDTATTVKSRPPKKTEMSLRVDFTPPELLNLARKQAEAHGELNRAEEEKKAATAQLKARCEGISARISELAGKITSGFEYRTVPCEVSYDDPKPGLKTTYRLDTGEAVNVDPMSMAERQSELGLESADTTDDTRHDADEDSADDADDTNKNY